jgi:hypothetical protein
MTNDDEIKRENDSQYDIKMGLWHLSDARLDTMLVKARADERANYKPTREEFEYWLGRYFPTFKKALEEAFKEQTAKEIFAELDSGNWRVLYTNTDDGKIDDEKVCLLFDDYKRIKQKHLKG